MIHNRDNQNKFTKNPLIIALDVDSRDEAVDLANQLKSFAGAYKLGSRLVHRYGESIVKEISLFAPVFVDCKIFDIPSTMEAAVRCSFESGATLVTVHALSGSEALLRLAGLEAELNKIRPFKILCVTILTSWDQESYPKIIKDKPVVDHVIELANLVHFSGLDGVVCSAHEIHSLKGKGFFIVVPGIRLDEDVQDQKRVMTPANALKQGASAIVIGRPIIEASDPLQMTQKIIKSITG